MVSDTDPLTVLYGTTDDAMPSASSARGAVTTSAYTLTPTSAYTLANCPTLLSGAKQVHRYAKL